MNRPSKNENGASGVGLRGRPRFQRALPRRGRRAFTLVEIMIVVTIIGLLAAISIPSFRLARTRALASRYANDFRTFAGAFEVHNLQTGVWPQETSANGALPSDMPDGLPGAWREVSPMQGGYTWSGNTARIRLLNSNATDEVMLRVDVMLDDGNLSTGDFRKMSSGVYHLQLH